MKRIIYLSLCACLLTSCSLDLQPENGLTYSNSFNTEKELNATTTSIQYYINTTVGNNYDFATAGVLADNILDGNQLREWNPRTVITSEYSWKGFYDIIFESNLLLDNIDRTKDLSPERRNYHVGQAEFGLGLSYFLLAQRYGMLSSQRTLRLSNLISSRLRSKCSLRQLNMRRKRMTFCLLGIS